MTTIEAAQIEAQAGAAPEGEAITPPPGAARKIGKGRWAVGPQTVVVTVLAVFLAWQVIVPLVALVYSAVRGVRPDDAAFLVPHLSLDSFARAYDSGMVQVSVNTVLFAVGSALLAVLLGTYLAFLTSRTDAVLRGVVASFMIYQLAIPSVIYPTAWIFIFGDRSGVLTSWWRDAFSATPPVVAESMPGMILVQSFEMLPMVYLFVLPAISAMNSALEEAAEIAGATKVRTLYDVGLKLAVPALVATLFIAILRAWDSFAIPWFLGSKVGIFTFSTQLFSRTMTPPSDTGMISAFAVPMVVVAIVMVFFYQRFNQKAANYAVMSGKNYKAERFSLPGPWRWLAGLVGVGIVICSGVLPVLMMVWLSLFPFFREPSLEALSAVSLDSYATALGTPGVLAGFTNSFVVGGATALLVIVVCTLSGWIVVHGRGRAPKVLDFLTSVPVAFPNIVVGICALWLYFVVPFNIRGTYLILVLTYFTLFLALGARVINSRLIQIDRELIEASYMSGASHLTAIRTIVAPLIAPATAAIALYLMASAFKELETAVLLSDPATRTASVVLYNATGDGTLSQTAAIGLVMTSGVLVLVLAWQLIARRFKISGF